MPLIMLSTYVLIYILVPKYLFKKKSIFQFSLFFILLIVVSTLLDRFFVATWDFISIKCANSYWHIFFHWEAIIRNVLILLGVFGLATIIKFFKLILKEEERNNKLLVENLETKHAFLKSQVNPHFLFNALNNIYSMSVQNEQDEIASNISNLSGIMKYLTYESNNTYVSLEKEIQLIKDYINIQLLRLDDSDDVTISFNVEPFKGERFIAPVILLPLVENCFKHGIRPDEKCLISVDLKVIENQLLFQTKNYFFPEKESKEIEEKGIGLVNVKKRLSLLYKDNHSFENFAKDNMYIVKLDLEMENQI